jgi:hypothetical protein
MKRILFCLLLALSLSSTSKAQLTITDSLATADIANLLSGFGVNISNLIVNCDPIAMGEFVGVSEIPISQGLLLTSGWADNLYGPNNNNQTTNQNNDQTNDNPFDNINISFGYSYYNLPLNEFDFRLNNI